MHEVRGNMHVHTTYSDGSGTHDDIARAALDAGLDFVFTTDHNVLVHGVEGYYYRNFDRVLLLTAEEIHDPTRLPQKNHMLVIGTDHELAARAPNPQELIDSVNETGGTCFLAHPYDPEAPRFNQSNLSWVDWNIQGFTGIELWNGMSEFKARLTSLLSAAWHIIQPDRIARGPFQQTLDIWDGLLRKGQQVVAIGGADAHALHYSIGPITRILFPYDFHFRAINTHLLLEEPFSGDVQEDRNLILEALRSGSCFVGYDLPHPTDGFRFTAQTDRGTLEMGEAGPVRFGATLQIRTPLECLIRVIHNGNVVKSWEKTSHAVLSVTEPGAYRVEAYILFKGRLRGWIFSNPVYLQADSDTSEP